jgi:SpoVK/Ycf46/Vps4 family AAA+-type ATPase
MVIYLYRLSLKSRGSGIVGEMTRLISEAFEIVKEQAQKGYRKNKKPSSAVILLIDEADALAQSREISQMHHEDRAGVNSLIRGIDTLANSSLPAIVLMCTNRLDSIDPAIRRRAVEIFEFNRPNDEQRKSILLKNLSDIGFSEEQVNEIVKNTGPNKENKIEYGYTYSDLVQRLLPKILINAYPDKDIKFDDVIKIINSLPPTKPFKGEK